MNDKADIPPVDAQPVEPLHWPTLVFQDGDGDLCRCDCDEQGFDYKQGREWFAQHLDAARAGDGLDLESIGSSHYPIDHLIGDLANTALGMQYVNPNGREDAYNQGVRDLIAAVVDRLRAIAAEGSER